MNQMIAVGLSLVSVVVASNAFAGVTDSVGTWEGSGVVFGTDGTQQSIYSIEMVNTAVSDHEVKNQVTVNLPDGTQSKSTQIMQDTNQGFSMSSDSGTGAGYCLGEGLCLAYIASANGVGQPMLLKRVWKSDSNTEDAEINLSQLVPALKKQDQDLQNKYTAPKLGN